MDDGSLTVVQPRHGFAHVAEDGEHFRFEETDLEFIVHQLEDMRFVERHEQQHFVDAVVRVGDAGIDVADQVLVPVQRRHDLNLPTARRQVVIVVDVHPFQRVFTAVGRFHQKNNGESTCFREESVTAI